MHRAHFSWPSSLLAEPLGQGTHDWPGVGLASPTSLQLKSKGRKPQSHRQQKLQQQLPVGRKKIPAVVVAAAATAAAAHHRVQEELARSGASDPATGVWQMQQCGAEAQSSEPLTACLPACSSIAL